MTTDAERPPVRVSGHLIFGLLIIVVGVLFTLDNLDIADAGRFFRYWPLGLIAVGIAKVFDARSNGTSPLGGVIFAGVGSWLLLDNLGYIDVSFLQFWPVLLVVIGGIIVWQGLRGREKAIGTTGTDTISAVAVLSGVNRGSNSASFRGGELTAFMGGCEIDLRQAAIHGEAVIDVFAMWGGIDIRVPDDWTVIGRVTPLLGGFDDKTRPPQGSGSHTLIIRGAVIMGGIEVKN